MTVRDLIEELEQYDGELEVSVIFNILDKKGKIKTYQCELEEVEEDDNGVNLIVYI